MIEDSASQPQHRNRSIRSRIRAFGMRHRVSISELGLLFAGLVVLAYIAFEVDIFANESSATVHRETIELDETLLLGGLLAIGLLIFAVRRYLDQQQEMRRRIAAEREARELAYEDPLTGLPNRRQFLEALHAAVNSPPRGGGVHALLLLDLNGFKQVNDTYGHGVGDEILIHVAHRLERVARGADLVARIGGDEFVVLAQDLLGAEAATSIALRILRTLDEAFIVGDVRHRLGAGMGIALLPEDACTEEEAIRKADIALYRAKGEHRSAFRFFEEEMDRRVHEREKMERCLRNALEERRIEARYRPAFDLRTGDVVSFEAVPVWIGRDGTEVPPDRFLPLAEETGLIHAIAQTTLDQACRMAKSWPGDVTLSIDLFPGQLQNPDLAETMLRLCAAADFDPHRLELEVAESTIVRDLEAAKRALSPLRDAGVGIVLDHFGTGYSNLYHMQEFRLDRVKIDRRFVENIGEADAARIVRALAGLGQGLGIAVSADGVQEVAVRASLLGSGVDVGQSSSTKVTGQEARDFFDAAAGPGSPVRRGPATQNIGHT